MGKLTAYNFITLDGYFEGPEKGDTSWHQHGKEEGDFAIEMVKQDNILLFGRVTYGHMASFWPSPMAKEVMPELAKGMNEAEKIVFSKTMEKANWQNTTAVKDLIEEVKRRKQTSAKDMTLLGSGSILTQLANESMIDEYQIMIDPIAIGGGTPIFKGLNKELHLKLTSTQTFKSGVVLLCYAKV